VRLKSYLLLEPQLNALFKNIVLWIYELDVIQSQTINYVIEI